MSVKLLPMKKVLFSKANSYRKPEFRVLTRIIEEDGKRYVEKSALCKAAISHIQRIKDNYQKLKNIYNSIIVLPYEDVYLDNGKVDDSVVRFPYIDGDPIVDGPIFLGNDLNVKALEEIFSVIFDYKEGYLTNGETKELSLANIDSVSHNFLRKDGKIWMMDYEWVWDYPVPIDYLKYRVLYQILYTKAETHDVADDCRFYTPFGIDANAKKRYEDMELDFQRSVFGNDGAYILRYKKNYIDCIDTIEDNNNKTKAYTFALEEIKEKDAQLTEQTRLAKERLDVIKAMENSKSWKLTKPLRRKRKSHENT